MARVKLLPCCVCLPAEQISVTEVHHITEGARRVGGFYCLPLCKTHHQYVHRIPKATIRTLWDSVNDTLGIKRDWPASKIVKRA